MIRPILHRLHSPDLLDMQNDEPEQSDNFCILVQAMVGPSTGPGEESFDFIVCTPAYMAEAIQKSGFFFGKGYLFIEYYSYAKIFDLIDSLCERISGADWSEVATKLGRYGNWEFEDYVK